MSLLSGVKTDQAKVLLPLAIVVFLALPVSITFQPHASAIGPTVVWAGSPDETLNPPSNPPPKRCASLKSTNESTTESTTGRFTPTSKVGAARTTVSSRTLFGVLWRVYWATVRF